MAIPTSIDYILMLCKCNYHFFRWWDTY